MSQELAGKRIIVTGSARGIGAAVMKAYVEAGARVAGMDMREDLGRNAAEGVGDFFACDVSNKDSVERVFDDACGALGGLDALAAVAGLDRPGAPGSISVDDWDFVMGVNARGTMLTNQAAYARMKEAGGAIINFGSVAGVRGLADRGAYSAAKGAVAAWSRAAALAWAHDNVRVNTIAPMMRTEVAQKFMDSLAPPAREAMLERLAVQIPIDGALGEPARDLAPLMIFLASDGARYITGQTFAVDGGMTMLGS
ncbi:MAG: SDR family NAD(P)-dependent oxidoreductase [Hyphomonadaceae bacterium]